MGQPTRNACRKRRDRAGSGPPPRTIGLGNIRTYGLYYHLGTTETTLGGVPGGDVLFTKLSETEGYVFGSGVGMRGPIASLAKLSIQGGAVVKTAGIPPATFTGTFPASAWLRSIHSLVALPEALLLFRTPSSGAPTLSACAHADATPCLTETPLPASLVTDADGNQLDGRFHLAHGRVYATQNTAGGEVRIVYCSTASVANGACVWAPFMSGFGAAGEGTLQFSQDDDHLYILRNRGERTVVERIAI